MKRKIGRPKGSKNKKKGATIVLDEADAIIRRKRQPDLPLRQYVKFEDIKPLWFESNLKRKNTSREWLAIIFYAVVAAAIFFLNADISIRLILIAVLIGVAWNRWQVVRWKGTR